MNIITADFNWFSFLIVIIGAVIGIIKSSKKRVGQEMSEPLESIFTFEEDESDDSTEVREEIKEEDKKSSGDFGSSQYCRYNREPGRGTRCGSQTTV